MKNPKPKRKASPAQIKRAHQRNLEAELQVRVLARGIAEQLKEVYLPEDFEAIIRLSNRELFPAVKELQTAREEYLAKRGPRRLRRVR